MQKYYQGLKNFYHLLTAILANAWFGFPSKRLYVIGVTGTNGKTTTVQMIARILENAGYKVGMSSTINFSIAGKSWVNKSKFTTLSSWKVQSFLARCRNKGCQMAVIETTSHALHQNRVWGVDFDIGVITNVTREHLDYHLTIKEYRHTKLKLFEYLAGKRSVKKCLSSKKNGSKASFSSGFSVINLGMQKPEEFMVGSKEQIYGYAIGKKNTYLNKYFSSDNLILAKDLKINSDGSKFKVDNIDNKEFSLRLPGIFNVENALAAICVGKILKLDFETMIEALASLKGVPGRMEPVKNNRGLEIIIDYALTPDSMKKVGQMISEKVAERGGRLFWIFGACGERDRGKRPIMGQIAARWADYVIVTNEDPYHEDPKQIINEIFAGVIEKADEKASKKEGENAFKIIDRRKAINKAIKMAKKGDAILVTGKGAEENMKIGDKLIDWNDKRVIKELLQSNI